MHKAYEANEATMSKIVLEENGDVYYEKMAKVMGYTGDGGRDIGVTNLNKISIQNLYKRFVVEDIMFVPPKVSYAKKVVGISTYADTLTLCNHKMVREA